MATKKSQEVIEIRPLDIQKFTVRVVGTTPLIMHKWSEKAKRQMLEAQTGTAKGKKKEARNPEQDFLDTMYVLSEEDKQKMKGISSVEEFEEAVAGGMRFGFPATAFKQSAISAAYRLGWSKDKMSLRGVFYIDANDDGLVEIKSDVPIMREDMVKVGMGTADLRYRAEFRNWYADLTISYNANGQYSLENILNMLNAAGYVCGVGEWRPERDGQNGMFQVAGV